MADGTAKIKTLDYKKASKNVKTVTDNKGNVIVTVPLTEKNKYLVVTIPKASADKKLESLHKSGLGADLKTKAFIKWINDNKELAVNKYAETKNQNFTFKLILIKGTDMTPVPEDKDKKKKKSALDMYDILAKKGITEKQVKVPDSIKIGGTAGPSSSSGKKAKENIKTADYVVTTKWAEKGGTFKNLEQILGTYYGKKGYGSGAAYSYESVPIVWQLEGKTTKLNFLVIVTTSDFGKMDITSMTKKQKEKAIDSITDSLLENVTAAFREKGIKLDPDVIRGGFKKVVSGMVDNIVQQRKAPIMLK